MNLLEINARIRQRPPFQMIERVTALEPGKSADGIKCVSVNEPYFQGHMPGLPIMPGVLLIESAAQLCSLVIEADGSDDSKVYVLLKVRDFKFVRPVVPGDRLEIHAEMVRGGAGVYTFDVTISCDGGVRAKGELMFTAVAQDSIYARESSSSTPARRASRATPWPSPARFSPASRRGRRRSCSSCAV